MNCAFSIARGRLNDGKTLEALSTEVAKVMKQALDKRVGPLEARLAALEAKPHVKFVGVWKTGTMYQPGDAATHQGALWICRAVTPGEPSKDFVGWQLAVKRGQP